MDAGAPLDPEALLAGPRGRRLCLALAQAVAPQDDGAGTLREAVTWAAYHLDPGRGRTVQALTTGGRRPRDEELPAPAVAEVAALLARAPAEAPDPSTLHEALAEAVGAARYWQEPDGEDVLAATPEVVAALRPTAASVAAAPGAAWWTAPLDPASQRTVAFEDPVEVGVPGQRPPAQTLARWAADTIADEERALLERSPDARDGISGEWWSAPPHDLLRTTRDLGARGAAGLWFVEDSYGPDRAEVMAVAVDRDARVLEIDGPVAWADLCRRHPLEVTAARRHDWYRTTGRDHVRWVLPDWRAVAAEVDAVHLTVAGYLTTAGSAVVVDDGVASVLAGWDPDATYWLTRSARPVGPARPWTDDDGGWRPA
jgi:hypothetical protein